MTNGEKIIEVFNPEEIKFREIKGRVPTVLSFVGSGRIEVEQTWWNAEYKIFEKDGKAFDNMIDEIQHWESDDTQDDYQMGAMDMQKYVLRVIDKYKAESEE